MTDKAVISEHTHRTLASQRANSGDMPVFVLPDDLPHMFRQTTRKGHDRFHVESLAIIDSKEAGFREFLENSKKIKAQIVSREDKKTFVVNGNIENLVKWWKDARRKGVAQVGADRSADRKKADIAARAKALTKGEWTNGEIRNAQLVEKYGASINALKRYASGKGWGWDRQKAIIGAELASERKERRNAKR